MFGNNIGGTYKDYDTHEDIKTIAKGAIGDLGLLTVTFTAATDPATKIVNKTLGLKRGDFSDETMVNTTNNYISLKGGRVYHLHGVLYSDGAHQYDLVTHTTTTSADSGTAGTGTALQEAHTGAGTTPGIFDYIYDLSDTASTTSLYVQVEDKESGGSASGLQSTGARTSILYVQELA